MRKKSVSILLALCLLLPLLAACGSPSDPAPVFSALELANAVSGAAADAPDAPETLDSSAPERLNTYIEAAYGLSDGAWEDCAVVMAPGMRAYEIAVLRFADGSAAKHGAECLEQYLTAREGAFFGYAPEEAALVSGAEVCREGLYVGLFICEDPAAARALFVSILKTGVLPEPEPTRQPEPSAAPVEKQPVDTRRLMVGVMESCIDEINAMDGVAYTINYPGHTNDYFPYTVKAYTGMDPDRAVAGFFVDNYYESEEVFLIHVLRMTDETAAGLALDGMRQYRADETSFYLEQGRSVEAERMAAGLERRNGCYVAQFVGADPEAMAAAFEAVLERLETEQLPEPAAEPQPVLKGDALRQLKDRLLSVCQDDVDAADSWSWMDGGDGSTISIWYGIEKDQWVSALGMEGTYTGPSGNSYIVSPDGDAFDIIVLCMTDEAAAIRGMAGLQLRAWNFLWQFKTGVHGMFDPPETVRVGSRILRDGRYLAMFICRDPEAAVAEFEAALSALCSAPPKEDDPPHGTAEAPLFLEVNWAPPAGDPDPDYQGRLLYRPPEDEYMTHYDNAAILAAWEKRDPAGLSDDERAIYAGAVTVLDQILREGMSDFEKEVAIYDWVVRNLTYDWTHESVLEETPRSSYTPYGGLLLHTGVCLGFASTFALLMEMAGVECITVIGAAYNSTEPHAWNMVKLDGAWYCVDPTWDKDRPRWEWAFFNVTTDYLARTNHQWDYANIPEATATDHGLAR